MTTLTENNAALPQKIGWRGIIVCQALGLAALAFVVFALGVKPRLMLYAVCLAPALLIIPKPSLIPYLFVASTFTVRGIVSSGHMFSVQIVDVTFLLLVAAFVSNKRVDLRCALREQRALITVLALFLLWALVGYAVNFYAHDPFVNLTSASYIFYIAQLVVAAVIFSQPQWKEIRGKVVIFFIMCVCFEIAVAVVQLVVLGRSLKLIAGTLGNHHSMLGNVMVLSAGVVSCVFFRFRGKMLLRLFLAFVCFMCFVTLCISVSGGNMMGLALAIPVAAVLGYRYKGGKLILLLAGIAVALAVAWVSPLRGAVINMVMFQGSPDNVNLSMYGRLLIWERVHEHLLYGPWLQKIVGIGAGTFNTLRFSYYLEAGTFTTGAHNNIMHVFVETGFVGLAIFLAVFFVIIRRLSIMSRGGDNGARCFLLCTLALFFSGITQETFWFNPSFGRFWLQYLTLYLILFNFNDKVVLLENNKNSNNNNLEGTKPVIINMEGTRPPAGASPTQPYKCGQYV